jgi:hypothetical protein
MSGTRISATTYLDRLAEQRVTRSLIRRLKGLGYEVTLSKAA